MSEGTALRGLTEGRTLSGVHRVDCDVVVIGSGAGGAPAAHELALAGLTVVVLEAGPWVPPEERNQRELDMIRRLYVDQGNQGPGDGSILVLQGSCVGGSTVVNGEVCFRTPDSVLREWALDFGIRGLSPGELAPVFAHVEKMISVTVNEGRHLEVASPQARGMAKLGLTPRPLARNVKDCRGCCYCFWGCAYGCKQSMEQSYLPAAGEASARLYSDARVERIHLEGGQARGVTARLPMGTLEVRSRAVVLAGGSVGTPLLLLDHQLGGAEVGRNLAVQPVAFGYGLFEEETPAAPSTMLASYCDDFASEGFLLEMGLTSRAFMANGTPDLGLAHKEMSRQIRRTWGGGVLVRDRSAPGRVSRDRSGKKVVDYRLDDDVRARLRRGMRRVAQIYLAGGASRVWFPTTVPTYFTSERDLARIDQMPLGPADIALLSYHPQGTARLGVVTDQDAQVRGTDGLYVMDGSLMPTPVGVNPQISIMALSTVMARRLAARLRG